MSPSEPRRQLTEALARLDILTDWERRPRGSMRVGLHPMRDLMQRIGNPQEGFRAVQVAGTKGKGSVCALIEAGLLRAGLRIGRYSSPHIECVTERVSILGQPADESELACALTQVLGSYEAAKQTNTSGAEATWFDVLTAAAFLMFKNAELDWAIVEVGLGGRLDSTNVVNAEIAVITNIELEHTEVLGTSREAIAREKVGILKPGAALATMLPVDDAAGHVLQEQADQLGCPVLRTSLASEVTIADRNAELAGLVLDYIGRQGELARADAGTDTVVGAWLLDEVTQNRARLPGRQERFNIDYFDEIQQISRTVPVILDGAHIPFNLKAVMRDLTRDSDLNGCCMAIVALAADKDAAGFLAVLSSHASTVIFTELPISTRGYSPMHLDALAKSLGMTSEVEPDPGKALERGVHLASKAGGWAMVTGSLHLVGMLRGGRSLANSARRLTGSPLTSDHEDDGIN